MQDRFQMSAKDAVDLLVRQMAVFEPMTKAERGEYLKVMPLAELRAALAAISLLQHVVLPALTSGYALVLDARGEEAPAGYYIRESRDD